MEIAVVDVVRLGLVAGIYLVIAVVTSRGFIAAPVRRALDREVERRVIQVRSLNADPDAKQAILDRLDKLRPARSWWKQAVWLFNSPLTKLYADSRELNAVNRAMVELHSDEVLDEYAAPLLYQLSTIDAKAASHFEECLIKATTAEGKRIVIGRVHELVQAPQESSLSTEFESQRVALWLAVVGLLVAVVVGLTMPNHQGLLLFGALGGFLAPVVKINSGQKSSTWGVMVLSPVGGALTALGGVLLIRFLSDPEINLLGSVFRDNSWDNPNSVLALALALLFGFSGRLFSRLAIAGAGHLTPPMRGTTPGV